jgi:hypothetical protein
MRLPHVGYTLNLDRGNDGHPGNSAEAVRTLRNAFGFAGSVPQSDL